MKNDKEKEFKWRHASFCFSGLKDDGLTLLTRFKWGHVFFELNKELLDLYASCSTSEDVVEAQEKWLNQPDKPKHEKDLLGEGIIDIENFYLVSKFRYRGKFQE